MLASKKERNQMENNTQKILDEIDENFKNIEEASPEYYYAFKNFMGEAVKESVLSLKTKELITVALAVASQCTFCISLHVKKASEAGASKAEIIEAAMVAGLIGGGPAVGYIKYVFDAIKDLKIN